MGTVNDGFLFRRRRWRWYNDRDDINILSTLSIINGCWNRVAWYHSISIAITREGRRTAAEPKSADCCNKHNDRSIIITTAVLSSWSSSWSLTLRGTDGLTIPSNRLPGLIDNGNNLPISFGKVEPSTVGAVNTKTIVLSYDPRRQEFVVCHKEGMVPWTWTQQR